MNKIFVGFAVASAAVVAAGSTILVAPQLPDAPSARRLSDSLPIAFGTRFPGNSDFQPQTADAGQDIWARGFSDFATLPQPQAPASADAGSLSAASPRVPMPKSRPLASKLMASLAPMSKSDFNTPTNDPLVNVSDAVRKVFAMLEPPNTTVASAAPDGGISADGHDGAIKLAAQHAALYDIAARTVYMPDGSRLEAHSGFADLLDDPSHVDVHDRGATPPQVYELTPREKLFHGVEALRMKPVGEGTLFGRSGLLTHSYMLGPNGDSNGCVSFKDYDAFLKAYKNGDVKRLIVVPSLADAVPADAKRA